MKSLIIILSLGFIEVPFESKLSCEEQGSMWLDMHTVYDYQETGSEGQGLYTRNGKLVYGFFCI